MRPFKSVVVGSALFGAGLGLGGMSTAIALFNEDPTYIVVEKWRTITTAPPTPIVLGHTSLNEDELRNLLKIQAEPPPPPPKTTTTTALPPVTTATTTTLPPTTTTTLPPVTTANPS